MANPTVDKLKDVALRHGEKAVVGITAAAFVALTLLAVQHPVLEMQPEELNTNADRASKNLAAVQPEDRILEKLKTDGLVEPNLQKVVDNQIANRLKPDDYRARLDWVTPEPGAGLIRDQPELIAPTELAAFPGRGGILMYALDEKGERKHQILKDEDKGKANRFGEGGGDPRMAGAGAGKKKADDKESPADKAKREFEEKIRNKMLTPGGKADAKDAAKEKDAAPAGPEGELIEETKGKRWIVVTGVLDEETLRKNYLQALKQDSLAYPRFKRLDVERRTRDPETGWGEFTKVDQEPNWLILDNAPESDAEYVPETKRPKELVDSLPLLKTGFWTGVHVNRLVPPESLETAANAAGAGGPGNMSMSRQGSTGSVPSAPGMGMSMQGEGGQGMSAPGAMGMPMGGTPGGGGSPEADFPKYADPELMIRALDFTVEPNQTYQYRVRIVVYNPNKDHTDVNPGVDTTTKYLTGPWSEPTNPVTVPADVASYALNPEEMGRRTDSVKFQVVKWDANTGQTVVKNADAAPGQVVGKYESVPMPPIEDGEKIKTPEIEFNSRAIVLDTVGGRQQIPEIGVERVKFTVPALAMIVEPDGSVVVRSQGRDKLDEVRKDMETNYNLAIAEAKDNGKDKKKGGSRMPGGGASYQGVPPSSGGNKKGGRGGAGSRAGA